jgi:hypothetical protein
MRRRALIALLLVLGGCQSVTAPVAPDQIGATAAICAGQSNAPRYFVDQRDTGQEAFMAALKSDLAAVAERFPFSTGVRLYADPQVDYGDVQDMVYRLQVAGIAPVKLEAGAPGQARCARLIGR